MAGLCCDSPNRPTQAKDLVLPLWTSVHLLSVNDQSCFLSACFALGHHERVLRYSSGTNYCLLFFASLSVNLFSVFLSVSHSSQSFSCVQPSSRLFMCIPLHTCSSMCVLLLTMCTVLCVCVHVPVPLSVVEQITQRLGSQMTNQWYTD